MTTNVNALLTGGYSPEQESSVVVLPQNYKPLNRGDMFVPSGSVSANMILARMATPLGNAGRNVHAVPIYYNRANSKVMPMGMIGVVTPDYKG